MSITIQCANCGTDVEIPDELIGDNTEVFLTELYLCDACETQRDDEADDLDHEVQYGTFCACCESPIIVDGEPERLALCRHCFEAGCDPLSTEPCKAHKRKVEQARRA